MGDKAGVSTSEIHLKESTEEDPCGATEVSASSKQQEAALYRYALIQGDLLSESRRKLEEFFKSIELETIDSVQDLEKLSPVSEGQIPMAIDVIFANKCRLISNLKELMPKSRVTSETPRLILYLLVQPDDMAPIKIKEDMSSLSDSDQWKTEYPNTFLIYKGGALEQIETFLDELLKLLTSNAMHQGTDSFRCISKLVPHDLPKSQTEVLFKYMNGLKKQFQVATSYPLDSILRNTEHWKKKNWDRQIEKVINDQLTCELKHSECYDTSGVNRVLIINNRFFNDQKLARTGAEVDEINLQDLFKRLGYKVEVRHDLKKDEMTQAVTEFSKPIQLQIASSVLVIMSHGTEGNLKDSDGCDVPEKELLDTFGKSKQLKRKPRLVVIQSCRIPKPQNTQADGEEPDAGSFNPPDNPPERPCASATNAFGEQYWSSRLVVDNSPDRAGIIIAHATLPGDPTYRNKLKGSRFITALCMAYHANADKMDVVSMINMVNASMTHGDEEAGDHKQLASWTIQTTKKYYLAKTLPEQNEEKQADDREF